MAANARQIFNVISGNKIFSALGKTRRASTFLGEVYWLSATEQTPTKRDAPKFECFLAGKGKHCFRNAEEVCLWILNGNIQHLFYVWGTKVVLCGEIFRSKLLQSWLPELPHDFPPIPDWASRILERTQTDF